MSVAGHELTRRPKVSHTQLTLNAHSVHTQRTLNSHSVHTQLTLNSARLTRHLVPVALQAPPIEYPHRGPQQGSVSVRGAHFLSAARLGLLCQVDDGDTIRREFIRRGALLLRHVHGGALAQERVRLRDHAQVHLGLQAAGRPHHHDHGDDLRHGHVRARRIRAVLCDPAARRSCAL